MTSKYRRRAIAAIEAGGTSFKVRVVTMDELERTVTQVFASNVQDPLRETVEPIIAFLKSQENDIGADIAAIGIASFGPIDPNPRSTTYGHITSTPKAQWRNFDLLGHFKRAFPNAGFAFDTDVNAPAVSEFAEAQQRQPGLRTLAYATVGTGIGVGLVVEGQPVHGLLHPEGGHMYAPLSQQDLDASFHGTCPFHGACIEGMANSISIQRRKGLDDVAELAMLSDDDAVWDNVAHYLAHMCVNILLLVSAEKIVLGGGVMRRRGLIEKIRAKMLTLLNGYLQAERVTAPGAIDSFLTLSAHGDDAGIVGAVALARSAL